MLIISMAALCVGQALLPFVNTIGIWILIVLTGFLRSGAGSLFNVMIFETKGVGSTYGGTATGLANTVSMIGAFLAPPLGNSLADSSNGSPFIFWAVLAASGIPLLLLMKTKSSRV